MPRPRAIPPDQLKMYLDAGFTQAKLAELFKVSESAISQAVKGLKQRDAALSDRKSIKAAQVSVWNVREKLEWCQAQAEDILKSAAYAPLERIAALNCIMAQIRLVISSLSTLYSIEEQAAFQEEVLAILGEIAPDAREKVLARLKETRPLRAILLDGRGQVSEEAGNGPATAS